MIDEPNTVARPLESIRVLDLTRVLAGPFCTMILADLGAEVIKVERPSLGDDARYFGPFLPSGQSAYFASLNRGKKSIVLDLQSAADRETLLKLAARANVLVENFRPGTLEKLGLDRATLLKTNPRLIVASTSGFGQDSPYRHRPAYDIVIQALSGLMSITGNDGERPVRVGTSISDILAGLFTAIGILAALRQQDHTGHTSELDVAMLDCSVAALENAVSRFEVTGEVPGPIGTRHPSITPFQAFDTADRPIVVGTGNDALWKRLCTAIACPEMVNEPGLATNAERTARHAEVEARLTAIFRQQSAAHWLTALEQAGIPCAPIRNVAEVVADPHIHARGMLHRVETAAGESFNTPGCPLHFDGHGPELSPHVPALGEHTAGVLRDWLGQD